jgi:hypothetical protein
VHIRGGDDLHGALGQSVDDDPCAGEDAEVTLVEEGVDRRGLAGQSARGVGRDWYVDLDRAESVCRFCRQRREHRSRREHVLGWTVGSRALGESRWSSAESNQRTTGGDECWEADRPGRGEDVLFQLCLRPQRGGDVSDQLVDGHGIQGPRTEVRHEQPAISWRKRARRRGDHPESEALPRCPGFETGREPDDKADRPEAQETVALAVEGGRREAVDEDVSGPEDQADVTRAQLELQVVDMVEQV